MIKSKKFSVLFVSLCAFIILIGFILWIISDNDRRLIIPGETSYAHHQIEISCKTCHGAPFPNHTAINDNCIDCHAEELNRVRNSHPDRVFNSPRNAAMLKKIDARSCLTCHTEHKGHRTTKGGVSIDVNFCIHCHEEVIVKRNSHANFSFMDCTNSGCHNYHDNRFFHQDFLKEHANTPPPHFTNQTLSKSDLSSYIKWSNINDKDQEDRFRETHPTHSNTPHQRAEVHCISCHRQSNDNDMSVSIETCSSCHQPQTSAFKSGKHGMRISVGLEPLTPQMARLPMNKQAVNAHVTCNSCHKAHAYNRDQAGMEVCLDCHADEHSRSFKSSEHGRLWKKYTEGKLSRERAVNCASCHMPALAQNPGSSNKIFAIEHNQSRMVRPSSKMIKPVCMQCHTLAFSLNSLSDSTMIPDNFGHAPSGNSRSIEMIQKKSNFNQ
ncbi:cytochrome c3 family protein [Alcanivorax sp.]|uniref:cytochrome c3 family protein n=1 Tax=Alcanivorax sp. TaxID=1872427 RepID=UPI002B27A0ED|nr:cytochrome c3 family protein [Alcanivorax sp.]